MHPTDCHVQTSLLHLLDVTDPYAWMTVYAISKGVSSVSLDR